jgi:hypothetical protein
VIRRKSKEIPNLKKIKVFTLDNPTTEPRKNQITGYPILTVLSNIQQRGHRKNNLIQNGKYSVNL